MWNNGSQLLLFWSSGQYNGNHKVYYPVFGPLGQKIWHNQNCMIDLLKHDYYPDRGPEFSIGDIILLELMPYGLRSRDLRK